MRAPSGKELGTPAALNMAGLCSRLHTFVDAPLASSPLPTFTCLGNAQLPQCQLKAASSVKSSWTLQADSACPSPHEPRESLESESLSFDCWISASWHSAWHGANVCFLLLLLFTPSDYRQKARQIHHHPQEQAFMWGQVSRRHCAVVGRSQSASQLWGFDNLLRECPPRRQVTDIRRKPNDDLELRGHLQLGLLR